MVEQGTKQKRVMEREAIDLATKGRWQEAVTLNREILAQCPNDVEALNRLGKALAETGRYAEARKALRRSLEVAPTGAIARKNLERLAGLADAPMLPAAQRVAPQVFLEESGKSITTVLLGSPTATALGQVHNGGVVHLEVDGTSVLVLTSTGQTLGRLAPKLASRLIRLQAGGNRYVAAVASVGPQGVAVVVRETYQSPAMSGAVSFPPTGPVAATYLTDFESPLDDGVDWDSLANWAGSGEDDDTSEEIDAVEDEPELPGGTSARALRALYDAEEDAGEEKETAI